MKDLGTPTSESLINSMELDTPTKPKQAQKTSSKKTKRKIVLGDYIPSEKSPSPSPDSQYKANNTSIPNKRVSRPFHYDDSKLKTPIRSSKRLGSKRKVFPILSPSRNESSEESPTRKVHFAVVPDSDPFCSPKQEATVPDIQIAPKTLFEPVFLYDIDDYSKPSTKNSTTNPRSITTEFQIRIP
jgi:hypothetical protein